MRSLFVLILRSLVEIEAAVGQLHCFGGHSGQVCHGDRLDFPLFSARWPADDGPAMK